MMTSSSAADYIGRGSSPFVQISVTLTLSCLESVHHGPQLLATAVRSRIVGSGLVDINLLKTTDSLERRNVIRYADAGKFRYDLDL